MCAVCRCHVDCNELLASQLWIKTGWIERILMDVQAKCVLHGWCVRLTNTHYLANRCGGQASAHVICQPKHVGRLTEETVLVELGGGPCCDDEVHVRPKVLMLGDACICGIYRIGLKTLCKPEKPRGASV